MNKTTWLTSLTLTPHEAERFWGKVDKTETCWLWTAPLTNSGYGTFALRGTSSSAHRVAYMNSGKEIPDGLVLDHLCRNRKCVNPQHLEAVTAKANSRRSPLVYKTHCSKGHEFTPENTRFYKATIGSPLAKHCLVCSRRRARESMQRHRDRKRAVREAA